MSMKTDRLKNIFSPACWYCINIMIEIVVKYTLKLNDVDVFEK